MKLINPETTVFIPDHNGVPRSPSEGPFTVSDKYAAHLVECGTLTNDQVEDVEELEEDEENDEAANVPDDLAGLSLAELNTKAVKDNVPLHGAKTKPTIIAAFVAHRAAQ